MVSREIWAVVAGIAIVAGYILMAAVARPATAATPSAGIGYLIEQPGQTLVHKADIFRDCKQIHWCSTRRDGTPYCGPTLRCRTCKFVRTCSRSTGCVWSEKCRWGPYVPPLQQ